MYRIGSEIEIEEMDIYNTGLRKGHKIFDAILGSNTEIVKNLIKTDRKLLGEKTTEGWTPLHVSVIYPHEYIVDFLLAQGSDPHVKDSDGKTPLHWAGYCNIPFSIFNKLIAATEHGLDTQDKYGRTPLHYICLKDISNKEALVERKDISKDLVRKLCVSLRANIKFELADIEGNTPLLLLCANSHNFYESEEVNLEELEELSGELSSIKSKSLCGIALEMLIQGGVDHVACNQHGTTAIHLACKSVCVEMVRLLLSLNLAGHIPLDDSGNTPMSLIFTSVSTCLSVKYPVKESNWFPLSDIKCRFEDTLRPVLKQMKPSVNIPKVVSGFTVLFYAVRNITSSSNVVKGLLGYGGANVNHKNFLGKSPLHYAGRPKAIVSSDLRETLDENWQNKVQLLLLNNTEINLQDLWGCSPLHDAALSDDSELIQILIAHGADVNIANKLGATPIHFLCSNTDENNIVSDKEISIKTRDAFDHLIRAGADVNRQDIYGSSALHYAVYSQNKGTVSKLLQMGADIDLKDINGLNPKEYSLMLGHSKITSTFPGIAKDIHALASADENDDCFMMPVKINNISNWLSSNMEKLYLSNDKLQKLLQSTNSIRLSNLPEKNTVLKQLLGLMTAVFDEVGNLDSLFKVTIELSGSTREGTKVLAPDEFDILCFLENFETVCVLEENEQDLVVFKLKDGIDPGLCHGYFDEQNKLLGHKLTTKLYQYIRKALSNPLVWKSAPGLSMDKSKDDYVSESDMSGIRCLYFQYSDATYKHLQISCDIVPAIRKRSWWPSCAKQNSPLVSSDIKKNGCMVIPKLHKKVTLSGERVRLLTNFKVSVYLSECNILLSLPQPILQAYKLAKLLLKKKNLYPPVVENSESEDTVTGEYQSVYEEEFIQNWHPAQSVTIITSYMLKNALLYELETEYPHVKDSKEDDDITVTRAWTVRIFRRLHRSFQDGCLTPYFLPNNSIIQALDPRFKPMTEIAGSFCKIIVAILEGPVVRSV